MMSDGTPRITSTSEGIQRKVTYQPSLAQQESNLMLADSIEDLPLTIGIYRITYHYEDSQGNVAEKVRTINVTAA